ncbi:apolipoprotein A-I-like [Cheilinus undulatus]|uniref:apolipoprotein A-I-like n=1 Tax=Cheilinus undulatus TaxID=241271 RepID=UPI001BD5B177|nr:apolipoprotein A-I-like [Cheilinus undulatus]
MSFDDAPSALNHARSVMNMYLDIVKDSTLRALEQIDHAETRDMLKNHVQNTYQRIKDTQETVQPMTDGALATAIEATRDMRQSIAQEIESLKTDLEPKREHLRQVVQQHMDQYRAMIEPIAQEYQKRHEAEMETLRARLEPVMGELKEKITTNWEETKGALMPIIESVRAKGQTWLQAAKESAGPYVQEYKEQIKNYMTGAMEQARNINAEDLAALRGKVAPKAQEVAGKLKEIMEDIVAAINKA